MVDFEYVIVVVRKTMTLQNILQEKSTPGVVFSPYVIIKQTKLNNCKLILILSNYLISS